MDALFLLKKTEKIISQQSKKKRKKRKKNYMNWDKHHW